MTDQEFYDACDAVSADVKKTSKLMRSPEEVLEKLKKVEEMIVTLNDLNVKGFRLGIEKGFLGALKWVLREE